VWVLGAEPTTGGFEVYRREAGQWKKIPGGLLRLTVDPSGNAWGTNDQNVIYRYDGRGWSPMPGRALDVAIGAQGTAFCVGLKGQDGNAELFEWDGSRKWKKISGRGMKIAVDQNDMPWVLTASNEIFRYDGGKWVRVPGSAMDLAIGANGAVWAIGTHQKGETGFGIYRWDGRRWVEIDGAATGIAVAPNGMPWVLNQVGQIFERV
jgi:Tectonin domain